MDRAYVAIVRLLLDSMPDIFVSPTFAMKGGTAINLFVQNMPRLSVDIDVVYTPHRIERSQAITEIHQELVAAATRLRRHGIETDISIVAIGDETKMILQRGKQRVKVEVNHVFRGTVMPVNNRVLVKMAADLFTTSLAVPVLATPELYGSKLVAALDRQHPRDWFDVHGMYGTTGLSSEIVECFVCYLAGHNRPVHEVLFSNDLDISAAFAGEFVGMEVEATTLDQLLATRARLRGDLAKALTDNQKKFLLGLVSGEADWRLMNCSYLADLPAIQWKVRNLNQLKKTNRAKFTLQRAELERRFAS